MNGRMMTAAEDMRRRQQALRRSGVDLGGLTRAQIAGLEGTRALMVEAGGADE